MKGVNVNIVPRIRSAFQIAPLLTLICLSILPLCSCTTAIHIPPDADFSRREQKWSFTGEYVDTYGTIHLEQIGGRVTGSGTHGFSGNISGNRMDGTWFRMMMSGPVYFLMSDDGRFLKGAWGRKRIDKRNTWLAHRRGDPVPIRMEETTTPQLVAIAIPPRTFPRRNIAVANLDALGLPVAEVLTLSESLRVNLLNTDYFTVVSRSDMARILEEQEWQRSSCSDTACLVEMGKLLSAGKIIGGTVGRVGDTFSVAVRMVDVESGRIDHSVMRNISGREDALLDAVAHLANELARQYAESRK